MVFPERRLGYNTDCGTDMFYSVTEECEGWMNPADGDHSNEDYGKNALTIRAVPSEELL